MVMDTVTIVHGTEKGQGLIKTREVHAEERKIILVKKVDLFPRKEVVIRNTLITKRKRKIVSRDNKAHNHRD